MVHTYSFPYPDLISEIKTAFSEAKLFSFFESAAQLILSLSPACAACSRPQGVDILFMLCMLGPWFANRTCVLYLSFVHYLCVIKYGHILYLVLKTLKLPCGLAFIFVNLIQHVLNSAKEELKFGIILDNCF